MPAYSLAWPLAGSLVDLGLEQDGVVGRAQLHALGVTRQHVRNEVRARRWRLVGRAAVILHRGPLSPAERRWAVLFNAGPRAALAGLTAAELGGLTGFATADVHVLVPRGVAVVALPGVTVHRSGRYDPDRDRQPGRSPPRTRLDRSVVDAATWAADPIFACAILAAAVQQRLTTAGRLRAELEPVRTARHRRILLAALGDIEGGSHSFAEIDAARLCRRAGLPTPTRQATRTDGQGRRRYLDLFWEADGICVEIDGGSHMRATDWRLDLDRQNEVVAGGLRMLRFATLTLRLQPDRFVDQLRRALLTGKPDIKRSA